MVNKPPDANPLSEDAEHVDLQLAERLAGFLDRVGAHSVRIRIESEEQPNESVIIPANSFRKLIELTKLLSVRGKSNLVTLTGDLLTVEQAARILNVSQRFLLGQIEEGKLPMRTGARILLDDLLEFKETMRQNRLRSLEELSAIDQELGLGYSE